jgi:hypothetical protein
MVGALSDFAAGFAISLNFEHERELNHDTIKLGRSTLYLLSYRHIQPQMGLGSAHRPPTTFARSRGEGVMTLRGDFVEVSQSSHVEISEQY